VHKRLNIGPAFYPPSVNSALYFIATAGFADGHQQTELNHTLPHGE